MSIPTPDQQQRALSAEAIQFLRCLVSNGGADADTAVDDRRQSRFQLRQLPTDLTLADRPESCRQT